jgi:MFS family permease
MGDKVSYHYRWIILGVTFITLALTGTIFHSFSIFFVALLKEFHWGRSITAGAYSVFFTIHGVIGPFAGNTIDRFGPKGVFVLGSVLWGLGFASCSLITSSWQFYISFGAIVAMGTGFAGWVPNATVIQGWFKEKRGLAMGILSSGAGIGIFVCIPTLQYLINEAGWRMAYRAMALFIPLVVITLALIFLKKPPYITSPTQAGREITHAMMSNPLIVDLKWTSRSWTLRQAIFTRQFWALSVGSFFGSLVSHAIMTHHAAFLVDKGLETLFVSYIVGMIGIVSVGGKILWGTLSDKVGREITFTLVMVSCILAILLLITFSILSSPYIPYMFAIFFGIGYAGVTVLPPLITADFFEGGAYGTIFGAIMILFSVGGASGAWFFGFLYDCVGNYILSFIIAIACALFASFNIWIAAPRKIRIVPGKKALRFKRNPIF